jgi:hypothetical protein
LSTYNDHEITPSRYIEIVTYLAFLASRHPCDGPGTCVCAFTVQADSDRLYWGGS